MNVALIGLGRMGRACETVLTDAGHGVVARIDTTGDAQGRSLAEALAVAKPDVAIEFSTPSAAPENIATILRAKVPVVCGTTAWDIESIRELANETHTPVLVAANFSIGMAVTKALAAHMAILLAPFRDFEPGIVERHHRAKQDTPSGTARMLRDQIVRAGDWPDVPVAALRQGGQPGEHSVIFDGAAECITLTHQARSPRVFAIGAIRAAEWLVRERPNGLTTFETFLERTGSWTQG